MYILDSDTIIYLFKNNPKIIKALTEIKDPIATTTINQAELLFGAHRSTRREENLTRLKHFFQDIQVLTFDNLAAEVFGEQKANLYRQGQVVADCDLMIASITIAHEASLVTNNIKHFSKVPQLQYLNWLD